MNISFEFCIGLDEVLHDANFEIAVSLFLLMQDSEISLVFSEEMLQNDVQLLLFWTLAPPIAFLLSHYLQRTLNFQMNPPKCHQTNSNLIEHQTADVKSRLKVN